MAPCVSVMHYAAQEVHLHQYRDGRLRLLKLDGAGDVGLGRWKQWLGGSMTHGALCARPRGATMTLKWKLPAQSVSL